MSDNLNPNYGPDGEIIKASVSSALACAVDAGRRGGTNLLERHHMNRLVSRRYEYTVLDLTPSTVAVG